MDEVLLEVNPFTPLPKLDPRLYRLIRHRQHSNAVDAQALRQLRRHSRGGPASREQLGPAQVHRQVQVAEAEPRLAAEALERVHAAERVAACAPAARLVDEPSERVQDRVDVGRDAQPVQRDVVARVDHDR